MLPRCSEEPARCTLNKTIAVTLWLDPNSIDKIGTLVFAHAAELNTWLPKQKNKQGINLLSGQDSTGAKSTHEEQAELAAGPREYISYLKPNLTIAMIDDFQKYPAASVPPPVSNSWCCVPFSRLLRAWQATQLVCMHGARYLQHRLARYVDAWPL